MSQTTTVTEANQAAAEAATRLYIADVGGKERLVRATSRDTTLRHVALQLIQVRAARPDDVERLMGAGVKPEVAGKAE